MTVPSIRGIKAVYIIGFALGVLFLALGIYGLYYVITHDLPAGHYSRLPFGSAVGIGLGVIMMWKSYPIFIPLKETTAAQSKTCPFCGAMVEETADDCEKCKQHLEE